MMSLQPQIVGSDLAGHPHQQLSARAASGSLPFTECDPIGHRAEMQRIVA
jgi:hypothetical protein